MEGERDNERIPYGLAVHDEEEERAVSEVIRNHQTIMGDNVKQFEREIADKFGKEIGVMVNSGSSANLLTFEVLNLPKILSERYSISTKYTPEALLLLLIIYLSVSYTVIFSITLP